MCRYKYKRSEGAWVAFSSASDVLDTCCTLNDTPNPTLLFLLVNDLDLSRLSCWWYRQLVHVLDPGPVSHSCSTLRADLSIAGLLLLLFERF